jgi:hypothetical protein
MKKATQSASFAGVMILNIESLKKIKYYFIIATGVGLALDALVTAFIADVGREANVTAKFLLENKYYGEFISLMIGYFATYYLILTYLFDILIKIEIRNSNKAIRFFNWFWTFFVAFFIASRHYIGALSWFV